MEIRAALATCRTPSNLRRTLTIAVIVGSILSIINEGDVIVHGNATTATGIKIGLNFVVPFIVSNLGVLAGTRTARACRASVSHPPPQRALPVAAENASP